MGLACVDFACKGRLTVLIFELSGFESPTHQPRPNRLHLPPVNRKLPTAALIVSLQPESLALLRVPLSEAAHPGT
jgi:hypothetical protein